MEEHSNRQRTPFLFTGKELDEETGLYYFGARYYDPRTSVWQSPDPILAKYLEGSGSGEGVFTPQNLNLYSYSHQRPIIAIDPNGEEVVIYPGSLNGWRSAELAEVRRLRTAGHIIIRGRGANNGRVSSRYDGDTYIRGREHDIVSRGPDGKIYLTEVKYTGSRDASDEDQRIRTTGTGRGSKLLKHLESFKLLWEGARMALMFQQLTHDITLTESEEDINPTLTGKPIRGGKIDLSNQDFVVRWVITGEKGRGLASDVNGEDFQEIIDFINPNTQYE